MDEDRIRYQLIGLALSLGLTLIAFESYWTEQPSMVNVSLLPTELEHAHPPVVPIPQPVKPSLPYPSISDCEDLALNHVFVRVEQPASPIGGMKPLYKHIIKNLRYPKEIRKDVVREKIFLSFVVECDGSLTHFEVIRSLHPTLDQQAIKLLKSGPKWKPGRQCGKAIRQRMTFPIIICIRS